MLKCQAPEIGTGTGNRNGNGKLTLRQHQPRKVLHDEGECCTE